MGGTLIRIELWTSKIPGRADFSSWIITSE